MTNYHIRISDSELANNSNKLVFFSNGNDDTTNKYPTICGAIVNKVTRSIETSEFKI